MSIIRKKEKKDVAQSIDAKLKDAKAKVSQAKEAAAENFKKRHNAKYGSEVTVQFQYAGKEISLSDIMNRVTEICDNNKAAVYIKPDENRVYFVSGNLVGSFEI